MQIDWFTFVAQIVNFLILVWLLKRFLYGPVIKAMDEREASIAARLAEAEQKQKEAEQEAVSYRSMKETLEQQRKEQIDRMREEVATRRLELMQEARGEVEKVQAEWLEAVRREQAAYLEALRLRAGTQVLATARRVLRDLADMDVEEQIVRVFTDHLWTLDEDTQKRLREAIRAAKKEDLLVRSAFEISPKQQQRITAALREQIAGETAPRFVADPDMGLGIELKAGGWKLAWSLESYLEALEESFTEALEHGEELPYTNRQPT